MPIHPWRAGWVSGLITVTASTRFDLPWYYTHGQGGYRFPLLPEWYSFAVEQPGASPELQYDRIISIFAAYELRCSGLSATGFSINGIPMMRIMYPISGGRIVSRTAAVSRGRRVTINTVSPAGTAPDRVPALLEELLGKTVFPQEVVAPPAAPATQAQIDDAPTVPPGWVTSHIGNVTVSVPPDWTASAFLVEGEGLWTKGDALVPEVSFSLVRNAPLNELTRGAESREKTKITVGGLAAEKHLVEATGSAGPEMGIILLLETSTKRK